MAAYNSAKAALAAFTMSIQLELPKTGVRIVDLQPADIRTEFNDSVVKTNARITKISRKNMGSGATKHGCCPNAGLVARQVLR